MGRHVARVSLRHQFKAPAFLLPYQAVTIGMCAGTFYAANVSRATIAVSYTQEWLQRQCARIGCKAVARMAMVASLDTQRSCKREWPQCPFTEFLRRLKNQKLVRTSVKFRR